MRENPEVRCTDEGPGQPSSQEYSSETGLETNWEDYKVRETDQKWAINRTNGRL